MHRGYIKLFRKIQDNKVWNRKPYSWGQAWLDLLLSANHKPGLIVVRGIPIKIKPGQVAHSIKTLSVRWGWSHGKVERFLKWLLHEAQIDLQKNNISTVITILNWSEYQEDGAQNGAQAERRIPPKRSAGDAQNGAQKTNVTSLTDCGYKSGSQETTQKPGRRRGRDASTNKNEEQEIKKSTTSCRAFSEDSTEFRLARLLFDLILSNHPTHKKPNLQNWAKEIDLMLRVDKRDPAGIEEVARWCQQDEFWKVNILSTAKLRKHFDRLEIKMGNGNPAVDGVATWWENHKDDPDD